ncbi:nucleotidyltransferase family protein [Methanococcus maripaludis]|uniref:protein adenylyltransferase n=1 Tax=Methanococcus maripaludis TaxID=39152 RepID=A0A7J9PLE2_METMI|nr:nucleotidyltransferase domain-containing protein [Methanococcus maripaludis]MBA2864042.1 hypothetical protein [Methanococcus maripaludis]
MKFGIDDLKLKSIVDVIKKYSVEKAVIFGSRARGDYKNTSDIDIAIYSKDLSDKEINLLTNELYELDIIYKIDLLEYYRLSKNSLKEKIELEGIRIL